MIISPKKTNTYRLRRAIEKPAAAITRPSSSQVELSVGSRKTMAAYLHSPVRSRKTMGADLYLPDDCWEYVFRFLNVSGDHRYLESLSLVSKQLLSLTNRLRCSLTICDPTLPRLVYRFPNLVSLDLTRFRGDLDAFLCRISRSPLHLRSLNLSNHPTIPAIGLRAFAKKTKTLTSLTCSNIGSLNRTDISLIAYCFPFLEELDLSFPKSSSIGYNNTSSLDRRFLHDDDEDDELKLLSLKLHNLRKVNLSGIFHIQDSWLFHLCKNCELLEEVVMFDCPFLTHDGIASAIRERPGLRSFSVTNFAKFDRAARHNITSYFIHSLVSLKGLTCLDLSFSCIRDTLLSSIAKETLPLRKLVLQGCRNYTYAGIFCLLSKCQFVQQLDLQNAGFLNDECVAELSLFLGDLVSINLSGCKMLTDLALIALIKNCPLLNEIRMELTGIGERGVDDSNSFMDFVVSPHHKMKSLHLARNSSLKDGNIKMLASICPNLQLLDLSSCYGISDGIGDVLRRCCKIRHLSLAFSSGVKLLGMNFEAPKLEVLNLSHLGIDDEALYVISKICCGLMQLDLEHCYHITEKGVRLVVENCTPLREINLGFCYNVAANVVTWMVFSRPSLRKITPPPHFHPSDYDRRLFLRRGCLVLKSEMIETIFVCMIHKGIFTNSSGSLHSAITSHLSFSYILSYQILR